MKGSAFLRNTQSSCGSFCLLITKGKTFVRFRMIRHTDNSIYDWITENALKKNIETGEQQCLQCIA